MTDYYSILGVPKGASADEVKKAYRKMASQHHPDKGGDTAKFQQIEEAYRVLSDPNQKAQYDNPQPEFSDPFGPFMNGGFQDIFRHFHFGDAFGHHHHRPARNPTVNMTAGISLEEAFYGKELLANVTLPSGKEQMVNVKIPAGIQHGTTLRLAGMGEDRIPGAPRGDIHLTINILPHSVFRREGDDLVQELHIPVWTAILGDTVRVKTLDNRELEMTIPAGTQFGQTMAVQGEGMPNMGDNRLRGRMLVRLNINIPTDLNDTQKKLLKAAIA